MPYIGNSPGTGTRNRFIYTATASQTTFSGADDNGKTLKYADSDYVDVYLNGICLVPVTDYTSTSKTSIVLTQAASLNDTLEVVAYDIATISDTVSKADGGTFEGAVTVNANFSVDNGTIKLDGNFPTGTNNVALGNAALDDASLSGNNNTAIGKDVLTANTSGGENTAVGTNALQANTTASNNTAVGTNAGKALTTGADNVAVGSSALSAEDGNGRNTAVGFEALLSLNAGADGENVAVGYRAGKAMTSGIMNTLIGTQAGDALTDADYNTVVGRNAMSNDTKGSRAVAIGYGALTNQNFTSATDNYNVGVGFNAGEQITTGIQNTFIGGRAGDATTNAADNVAVGFDALTNNVGGQNNVAIGVRALRDATVSSGNIYNTAVGSNAGRNTTSGTQNTYLGSGAGLYATTNDYTTFVGTNAGYGSSGNALTDNFNVAVGYEAGFKLQTTANKNTFLGTYAGYFDGSSTTANGITTGTNNTAVGFAAYPSSATANNEFTLGNSSVGNLRCNDTSISSLSDERDKPNFVDVPLGLDLINTLRPVAFDWNRRDGSKQGLKDFGFIAQELKTAQDATDYADHMRLVHVGSVLVPDAENTNATEDEDGMPIRDVSGTMQECLEADPMKTYPVLVKAVQELSTALDAALARIKVLEG